MNHPPKRKWDFHYDIDENMTYIDEMPPDHMPNKRRKFTANGIYHCVECGERTWCETSAMPNGMEPTCEACTNKRIEELFGEDDDLD